MFVVFNPKSLRDVCEAMIRISKQSMKKKKEERDIEGKCDECRTKEKGEQPKHDPILEREGGIYLWFRVDRRGGKIEKRET
jgi:hypothetical protein